MPQSQRQSRRCARLALLAAALAAAPALAAETAISQSNQTFSSPTITVHVGDTVRFQNKDTVSHNITVRNAANEDDADDLGMQKPGVDVTYHFATRGAYRIICSIHPRMRMAVNVQ